MWSQAHNSDIPWRSPWLYPPSPPCNRSSSFWRPVDLSYQGYQSLCLIGCIWSWLLLEPDFETRSVCLLSGFCSLKVILLCLSSKCQSVYLKFRSHFIRIPFLATSPFPITPFIICTSNKQPTVEARAGSECSSGAWNKQFLMGAFLKCKHMCSRSVMEGHFMGSLERLYIASAWSFPLNSARDFILNICKWIVTS